MVQLGIATIGGSPALHITAKDVDNSMLNFFGDGHKIHIITTSCRTFHLSRNQIDTLEKHPTTLYSPGGHHHNTGRIVADSQSTRNW